MDNVKTFELKKAIQIHKSMVEYRDERYINLMQQINTRTKAVLTDDMGTQFVHNCGRDIAGEVVRNFFNTADYNITVDQLAERILKFSYEEDYDPIAECGNEENIRKSVYNYGITSKELKTITDEMDHSQVHLFEKEEGNSSYTNQSYINKQKDAHRQKQREGSVDGKGYDDYNNQEEQFKERNDGVVQSRLDVDHTLDLDGATYNSKYVTDKGREKLIEFYNSDDNFAMMLDSANRSKGAVKVYDKNGIDITHRASPEQIADAVCAKWENAKDKQALIDAGYLNKDGTVSKSVKRKLVENARHAQNQESKVILANINYGEVGKSALDSTKAAIGKIIAGQIIYYAAPPLVFEVRCLLKDKKKSLDDVLSRLSDAAKRIGKYVLSKLKNIFKNVLYGSLKKFIKSFMEILINVVKATVKKLLKMAKNLILSTVDAIRIILDKNATAAEKADSVVNLFAATITSCVVEVLFEVLAKVLHVPSPFDDVIFAPLQILTTIVCTNLTMLILQKADLFDVRFGYKINAVKQIFAEERERYDAEILAMETDGYAQIDDIINFARSESKDIYDQLQELDPKKESVRGQLKRISNMFSMEINYDKEWLKFIGIEEFSSDEVYT